MNSKVNFYSFPITLSDNSIYYEKNEIEDICDHNGFDYGMTPVILNNCFYDVVSKITDVSKLYNLLDSQLQHTLIVLITIRKIQSTKKIKESAELWLDQTEFQTCV